MLILLGFKAKIHGVKQRPQLVVSFLTDIGYTRWQVMYMNGVQIGMMRITTTLHHLKIQKGQNQAQRGDEYYEVGLGIILQANTARNMLVSARYGNDPADRFKSLGFRCVSDVK